MQSNTRSLTEGSIVKTLLIFAIPYMVANLIQALYGAVDMAVVGWFADSAGISAVSTGSQVMQIVTSLVSGLTMGGTILIAQFFGGQRQTDATETISTMLTLFAVAAAVFTLLMFLLCEPILRLLQTPAEAMEGAKAYVRVCSGGIFFIFGYNAISAILRGLGDSKSPVLFIGVACVCNIVLDLLLVGGFHMGPAGAALATIASQGISLFISILYLSRRDFLFSFRLSNFRLYKDKAARLLKLGLPVSLQETMVNLSFLFITAIVNHMGVVASAAVGVCGKFEGFAMLPAGAFSSAIAAMTAQNMGANQPDRAKEALKISVGLSFLIALGFFGWAQLAPDSILAMFRADAAVQLAGGQYLRTFSIDFLLVAFVFCMNGFFNGCGRTAYTMVNGILSTVLLRVPMAYLFSRWMPGSLLGIGLAAPLASFASIVAHLFYLRTNRWRTAYLGDASPSRE